MVFFNSVCYWFNFLVELNQDNKWEDLDSYLKLNQDKINSITEYLANLILQSEKSRKSMRDHEIHTHLVNSTNEVLIHIDVENKVSFWSNSSEIFFGCSKDRLIGININELFGQYNPEISLMIKNSMVQNYKDYILIENITFRYPWRPSKDIASKPSALIRKDESQPTLLDTKINLCCYKMSGTLYSLGHVLVLQPIAIL